MLYFTNHQHSINFHKSINPFQPYAPLLYPLKTFSGGLEMETFSEMG